MNLRDMKEYSVDDENELGMRVAVSLMVENETDSDNFIRILAFKHKMGAR